MTETQFTLMLTYMSYVSLALAGYNVFLIRKRGLRAWAMIAASLLLFFFITALTSQAGTPILVALGIATVLALTLERFAGAKA